MKEETFKKAENLRNKISHNENNIKNIRHLMQSDQSVLVFKNGDVRYKDVAFFEDPKIISDTMKIALLVFIRKLEEARFELEKL